MERRTIPPVTRPKAELAEIQGRDRLDLAALAARETNVRCLLAGTDRELTLRVPDARDVVPDEILAVRAGRAWRWRRHAYLSGTIESRRVDVAALGLRPLALESMGMWDPDAYGWGEIEGLPEDWAVPILKKGPRPLFRMEHVLPGDDSHNPDTDPILDAIELNDRGSAGEARDLLMDLLERDLRCIDAHVHLGNLEFDLSPAQALRHYRIGVRIGDLSLAPDFDGVLAWGMVHNRPFLRCLYGLADSLWRLGSREEARRVFERMLWLNPPDNQGVRFAIDAVRAGMSWDEFEAVA